MRFALDDGTALFAYTGGKPWTPGRPTVVFAHGALHDHSVWTLLARWYAHHGHAVLAVDLPGHGRSDGPVPDSVEAMAGRLLVLLEAAGAGEVRLVGHSMGALVALEMAARAPQRAAALVLLGMAYPMKVSPALLATAAEDPGRAIAMVNAFSHSGMAAKPSYPGPGTWLHGANAALMHRMQAAAPGNLFAHDFRLCDAYARGLEAAAAVRCPARLIAGIHDVMTPRRATAEIAGALRAEVVDIAAGHALMQEAPDAVLNALRQVIPALRPPGDAP